MTDGKWHYLTLAYDANASSGVEMEVFLDGESIGSTNRFGGPMLAQPDDRWYFGLADPQTPSAGRYLGKLDDVRFFSKALSLPEHQVIYNHGSGDLALTVVPSYPTQTHENPIVIDLSFWKYGQPWPVEFNATRYSASNTSLHSVSSGTAASHRLELNATADPSVIQVNLLEGLGVDGENESSVPISFSIGFGRPIVRMESLEAWWTFDEGLTNPAAFEVTDYLKGYVGTFQGDGTSNVTFDSTVAKFGASLRFPQNAWVSTDASSPALGISGNKPRTISFWMYAENGQKNQGGPYGIGQRNNYRCWAIRSFWDGNYRRFRSQHWGWDPDVYVSEGVRDRWAHVAHIYTGSNVQVYVDGSMRRDWVQTSINTGSAYTLQIGRWTEENNNLNRTFKGCIDDFRVYSAAFTNDEVKLLYGNGFGDLSVIPTFSFERVVDGDPVTGEVSFTRAGKEIAVYDFNESDLSLTNGSIVANSLSLVRPGVYSFQLSLNNYNQDAVLSLAQGLLTDDPRYAQPNEAAQVTIRKMFRAVTRAEDLLAWWPFDSDPLYSSTVISQTPGADTASLYNAEVSPYGRFGYGLRFDKDKTNARMRHDNNGVDITPNSWTLSAWAKDLLPPVSSGRSTLFRGKTSSPIAIGTAISLFGEATAFFTPMTERMVNGNNRYRSTGREIDTLLLRGGTISSSSAKGTEPASFWTGLLSVKPTVRSKAASIRRELKRRRIVRRVFGRRSHLRSQP